MKKIRSFQANPNHISYSVYFLFPHRFPSSLDPKCSIAFEEGLPWGIIVHVVLDNDIFKIIKKNPADFYPGNGAENSVLFCQLLVFPLLGMAHGTGRSPVVHTVIYRAKGRTHCFPFREIVFPSLRHCRPWSYDY